MTIEVVLAKVLLLPYTKQRNQRVRMSSKAEIRQRVKGLRDEALDYYPARYEKASLKMRDHFLDYFSFLEQQILGGYAPLPYEADCMPLLEAVARLDHKIALPRSDQLTKGLIFHLWEEGDTLSKGPYSLREPNSGACVLAPTVLIVPLVAFNERGYRLGKGKGYYDRYLEARRKTQKILAVGYAFEFQFVRDIPIEPFDQKLDFVVTENKVWKFV